MDIPREDCHFGYFDMEKLETAKWILTEVQGRDLRYDKYGKIFFERKEKS